MSTGLKIGVIVALAIALLVGGIALGIVLNFGRFMAFNMPMNNFSNYLDNWMHGYGGMMGGRWSQPRSLLQDSDRLSLDDAVEIAESYLKDLWGSSLEIAEVMQFDNHFYVQAVEIETGINAFEFLIDPVTGAIHPEPGPNMMWNTKYGMMGGYGMMGSRGMMWRYPVVPADQLSVSPERARELAQEELDRRMPGSSVDEDVDVFYGYYTLHILKDGKVTGMLSVRAETGQVWLHTWHGNFVDMTEHPQT